jgi:hypothetical protein
MYSIDPGDSPGVKPGVCDTCNRQSSVSEFPTSSCVAIHDMSIAHGCPTRRATHHGERHQEHGGDGERAAMFGPTATEGHPEGAPAATAGNVHKNGVSLTGGGFPGARGKQHDAHAGAIGRGAGSGVPVPLQVGVTGRPFAWWSAVMCGTALRGRTLTAGCSRCSWTLCPPSTRAAGSRGASRVFHRSLRCLCRH